MIGSRYEKSKILTFDERIDPASTALVVVDVQNDFALPQGVCGQVGDDISPVVPMIAKLKTLIDAARDARMLIVFVRTIYDEPFLSPALAEQYLRRGYPNSICLTGSRGAEFYDGIGPLNEPNEILVTKHRYSAFWGSSVDLVLRTNGIRTLVLTGIATEVCVKSTARDAFFRDYQVVVPEDCVGSYSEERQRAAMIVIARSFGVVTSSADIIPVWRRSGNGPRNWHSEIRAQRHLTTLESQLRPEHTAFVLINLLPRFYDMEPRGNTALVRTLPEIKQLLEKARQTGCFIIHTRSMQTFQNGDDNTLFMPGLGPLRDEAVVNCHRYSAFADTQLDVLLRSNCIRTTVFVGATTNCAVETTAREAADRDYHVIVAGNCVAAPDVEFDLHVAALENIRRYFGTVADASEIASHWNSVSPSPSDRSSAQGAA